jgi:hypothetical protein
MTTINTFASIADNSLIDVTGGISIYSGQSAGKGMTQDYNGAVVPGEGTVPPPQPMSPWRAALSGALTAFTTVLGRVPIGGTQMGQFGRILGTGANQSTKHP